MHRRKSRLFQAVRYRHRPERNHAMLMVAFSLLLSILIAPYAKPGLWPWALLPVAAALGALCHVQKRSPVPAILLAVFALGLLWTQVFLHPAQPTPGRYAITGTVYGEPALRTEHRMTFLLNHVRLEGEPQAGEAYCTLYTYGDEALPLLFDGAEVSFTGRVYHPEGKRGPHDFDFRMWMLQNRTSYGISSVRDLRVTHTPATAPWNDWAARLRAVLRKALTGVMQDQAGLAMGMLFSDREGMAQDEREAFERAGIAHVLSVSGLHVGILGGLLMGLLGRLRMPKSAQLPLLALLLMGYCALSGFSAAAVRAAVMLVTALGARRLGRRPDPLLTLATAMVVVLAFNPLQLFSAGFALSFSAMAGILLLQPVLLQGLTGKSHVQRVREWQPAREMERGWAHRVRRLGPFIVELLSFSLAAQLGVLLPTAAYFHQLPLYGVAINLLVVPLMGFLVPFYFVTLCLSWVPWVGMAVGAVAKALSAGLLWLVKLVSALPYAAVRAPSAPLFVLCGAALWAVLASRYFRASRPRRWAALALAACLAGVGAYAARPKDLRYIQLSAGQADAALILDGPATVAVDVGEFGTELAAYLLAEGRDLDGLFLTHLHLDHVGGVPELLEAGIHIRQVFLPAGASRQRVDPQALAILDVLRQQNIPLVELAAGEEVRYNKVSLRVLWPIRHKLRTGQDANDLPLVLSMDLEGYTLFSGSDLTGLYERYAAVPADILKVAHHGSADSTYDDFLDFVKPRMALITCAPGDKALPAGSTLQRLAAHGIPVYRTDESGDITITVENGQLVLTPYK